MKYAIKYILKNGFSGITRSFDREECAARISESMRRLPECVKSVVIRIPENPADYANKLFYDLRDAGSAASYVTVNDLLERGGL